MYIFNKIRMKIDRINLKQRLIFLIILAALIPITVISYLSFSFFRNTVQEQVTSSTMNIISQISMNIDELINGGISNLSNIVIKDKSIYSLLTENKPMQYSTSMDKIVKRVLLSRKINFEYYSVNDNIKVAALYGKNGQLYNIALPSSEDNSIIDKVIKMEKVSRSKTIVTQWYPLQENFFTTDKSGFPRRDFVNIATRAIYDSYTGEYWGTQYFTIYEEGIHSKYSDLKLGKTGEIFVIDKNGNLVSHSDEKKLGQWSKDTDMMKEIVGKNNNTFTIMQDGKEMLVVTKKSRVNYNWITVGVVPLNELYDKGKHIYNIFLAVVIISVGVLIFFVALIADSVTRPIRKIIKSMELVERGDFNVNVDIKGQYEVSKLGKYFNNMIFKINKLIEEEYRLEKKKKEAELNVLMAQINPHFLYNTLESISWKANEIKAYEISKMASSLGRLFRIAVNRGSMVVPVSEEINHVKAYIEIQKIRYSGKFDFGINIDDEKINHYKTLKLVLQPIVENSLTYGIGPNGNRGSISVNISSVNEDLIFRVVDNGVGISKERLAEVKKFIYSDDESLNVEEIRKGGGIGLKNVYGRLKLYFGEKCKLELISSEGTGTEVIVTIPVIEFD